MINKKTKKVIGAICASSAIVMVTEIFRIATGSVAVASWVEQAPYGMLAVYSILGSAAFLCGVGAYAYWNDSE